MLFMLFMITFHLLIATFYYLFIYLITIMCYIYPSIKLFFYFDVKNNVLNTSVEIYRTVTCKDAFWHALL